MGGIKIYNPQSKSYSFVSSDDIVYVTVQNYTLSVHFADQTSCSFSGTLEFFKKQLPDCFCKLRRNMLVNMNYVKELGLRDCVIRLDNHFEKISNGGKKAAREYFCI